MLKYGKIKVVKKPDSLLSVILSVGQIALVIVGLIGVSVEFFSDKGLLKQTFSAVMKTSSTSLLIGVPVALVVFLVGKSWLDSHSEKEGSNLTADLMLYVMMLIGAWYIYKLVTEGSF